MIGAVRVPASSANLGPGFDALSVALAMYLDVRVELTESPDPAVRIRGSGVDAGKIPSGPENLVVRVLDRVAQRRGRLLPPAVLDARNEIPLARGMGSSSTAIIAGISCYEILARESLSDDEVFEYAHEFETHPDNLAAALHGGLTVSAVTGDGKTVVSSTPVPRGVVPVLVIPESELSTEKARSVLPATYDRADVVFNVQRSALLVAALTSGRWELVGEAMKDRIHQPYRARLVPGLDEALGTKSEGLVGTALSGAGPTVLALALPERADQVGDDLVAVFRRHGVRASARVAAFDSSGRVFRKGDERAVQEGRGH
jgi:homoserine kinase